MTDKEIIDYCKNCSVEPPAMRFKCPECEHNPDNENNFEKDINVPHKHKPICLDKPIYLDGVDVRNCKGIDLSLPPLVKCKFLKFKTSDGGIAGIWCSDHTNCCFKQLARKTTECEDLKERLKRTEEDLKYQCVDCMNVKSDRYRKALEEIEQEIRDFQCDNCEDYHCETCDMKDILDIINKAKDGKNEN